MRQLKRIIYEIYGINFFITLLDLGKFRIQYRELQIRIHM